MKQLRVLIADDHEIVRQGVRAMLQTQPDLEVCGEAMDGREAVAVAARLKPHLVVMDIAMPEMNGLEATRQIVKNDPSVEVLILTMHESEELVRNVLSAGARGYVLKSDVSENLLSAVHALARHQVFITSKVTEVVLQSYLNKSTSLGVSSVFPREVSPRERRSFSLSRKESPTKKWLTFSTSASKPSKPTAPILCRSSICTLSATWSATRSATTSSRPDPQCMAI